MNPFLSVWFHPKQTARYVIEQKSLFYVFMLIILGYIAGSFSGFTDTELYINFSYVWIFLIALILGPIVGIIVMFITSGIVFLVGKLLQGTGSFWDIFKACSLSSIPSIITGPLYILWMFVSPESYFYKNETSAFAFVMGIIILVVGIWSVVIIVAAVAEAHQFSIMRSIVTLIIPAILIAIFIFVVIAVIMLIIFAFFATI